MAPLSRLFGKSSSDERVHGSIQFPLVLKEAAREAGSYSHWIHNHRWNKKNEAWCLKQIAKFKKRPTIGILMQSSNPRLEFLQESFASIFNQVYPFHRLYVVDRGSDDKKVRDLIKEVEKDPRVKVSFQKSVERDTEAIARIMKKADSEWLLLMGAEDVIEPYALYYMAAFLQDQVEIDFVFADSDLMDDHGLRFAPQFKPVWAVGSTYPLGYYQHPVMMSARIVEKLKGYERVVALMEKGELLDEASNHSRYVIQVPGILYHARERGLKNETPPEAVWNVLVSESLVQQEGKIEINPDLRIAAEPPSSLRILWILDSLEFEDGPLFLFSIARALQKQNNHEITILSTKNGPLFSIYEQIGKVTIVKPEELAGKIQSLNSEHPFDVAFAGSLESGEYPPVLNELSIPTVWHLPEEHSVLELLREHFDQPATILTPSLSNSQRLKSLDPRGVLRELQPAADLAEIKLYKQTHSPIDLREKYGISRTASVVTIVGPTVERKGQKVFVKAAIELLERHPDRELEFFIVGERPGQYLNELKQQVQHSTFSDRFHFIRETNSPFDRYPYYWISDLCVSCSTKEVFPIATLEAMGFKKAVIGTRIFRTQEVIHEDGNG
ncbi:MAG TPA: glycosyltransferase, partial [Acidobacteriota bacterium]|nr:glycosyltransferase [Acidobacteriota bacterium]